MLICIDLWDACSTSLGKGERGEKGEGYERGERREVGSGCLGTHPESLERVLGHLIQKTPPEDLKRKKRDNVIWLDLFIYLPV